MNCNTKQKDNDTFNKEKKPLRKMHTSMKCNKQKHHKRYTFQQNAIEKNNLMPK
jgi:hypothetical protein